MKLFDNILRDSTTDSEYAYIRQEKIGFVFQSFNLIGSMSALENVELPMMLRGVLSRKAARERVLFTKINYFLGKIIVDISRPRKAVLSLS